MRGVERDRVDWQAPGSDLEVQVPPQLIALSGDEGRLGRRGFGTRAVQVEPLSAPLNSPAAAESRLRRVSPALCNDPNRVPLDS